MQRLIQRTASVLELYYGSNHWPLVMQCLREPVRSLGNAGRVLCRNPTDAPDVLEMGLEFGAALTQRLTQENLFMRPHDIAVLAEELSHMHLLIDASATEAPLSRLDLEVMGEIDRFLVLMHWNTIAAESPLTVTWRNFDHLCDVVFSGQRFQKNVDLKVYILAEESAFAHLRNAFSRGWEASQYDFSKVDDVARTYLQKLRKEVLTRGRPARLLKTSA